MIFLMDPEFWARVAGIIVIVLQLVGGAVLLWIAFKLVGKQTGAEGYVREGSSLREAIWIIIVADAVMSLDNVLAVAAAAHSDLTLVVFGIALSLPIVG